MDLDLLALLQTVAVGRAIGDARAVAGAYSGIDVAVVVAEPVVAAPDQDRPLRGFTDDALLLAQLMVEALEDSRPVALALAVGGQAVPALVVAPESLNEPTEVGVDVIGHVQIRGRAVYL